MCCLFFFLMIRRPPRSTLDRSSAASDVYKRQGRDRGVCMGAHHRMLRVTDDNDALRRHFELGVNFVASLVNRHRIEAYILDAGGRVAMCYERIHWDEQQLVDRAIEVLSEQHLDLLAVSYTHLRAHE